MSMSSRRFHASSLLATTSVAALLLGALASPARAQTPVVVTNPAPVDGTVPIGPDATAVVIDLPSFTGNVVNPNFLPLNQVAGLQANPLLGTNTALAIKSTSFTGSVTNAGAITANALAGGIPANGFPNLQNVIGIAIGPAGGSGGTFTGSIINSGLIVAIGQQVRGLNAFGNPIPGTQIPANFALASAIKVQETVTGSIVNTGTGGFGNALFAVDSRLFPFTINAFAPQSIPGALDVTAPVLGGIRNAGFISATNAVGIRSTAAIPGGIVNTGYIGSGGATFGNAGSTVAAIVASGPLQGGITNSGTIASGGSPSPALGSEVGTGIAIDVSQVTTPTTITQTAGQILGSIALSGNADRLVITGGGVGGSITAPAGSAAGVTLSGGVLALGPNLGGFSPSFAPGPFVPGSGTIGTNPDSASNLAFITQTGGTLVLQVNNTAAPGTFPTVSAGNITLTSVAAAGQQGSFAAGTSLTFPKIITATGTLTDNAPSNLILFDFFSNAVTAKLVPDGANSLDLVLTNTGTTAVTPGVANGISFTGNFLNPAGGLLLPIGVTNGSNITGTIRNDGVVASGITLTASTLAGSIVNTGIVEGGIGVAGLVTGNGTIAGGVANSGIVTPARSNTPVAVIQSGVPIFLPNSNALSTNIRVVAAPSFTGNISNSGFLLNGNGIFADGGPITGSITNSGQIFNANGNLGFQTLDEFIAGTPSSGTPPAVESVGIRVGSGPLAGGITNSGDIHITSTGTTVGNFADLGVSGAVGIGVIGSIGANQGLNLGDLTGVNTAARQTITGDIVNSGTIEVSASHQPIALGIDVAATGLFAGNLRNSGSITATGVGAGAPGQVNPAIVTTAEINQAIADNGGVIDPVIANLLALAPARAVGIQIGATGLNGGPGGPFKGAVVNSGVITAIGAGESGGGSGGGNPVSGIGIATNVPILGGITNTGTITGSTASIDLTQEVGGSTVINQAGGALVGDVKLSANADTLNFSGGLIVNAVTAPSGNQDLVLITGQGATFAPTASTSGVSAFTVSPDARLTLQVTPTQAPSINANAITLGGTLRIAPQGISPFALATTPLSFKDVFVSGTPIRGAFTTVNVSFGSLFTASVTPDGTTPNALDVSSGLSLSGLSASAQDLTQDLALGLDAPPLLTGAVQDRLIASGGVLGEDAAAGAKGVAGFSFGNANVWARGADQFGSATAHAASASVGYDINRAAPFIAGVDWRLDNGIVAGVAATYVATSAKFKDGSSTNVSSYQGAAYAGWTGGPWYALASAVVGFNDFGTSRLLTNFGLPGDATSSPSGQSYQGHAEAGYHWALPAGGVNVSVTPYAALDYVNAHISGFSENGGFGALSVNATDANSFQTTLGVRLTSRIALAGYGTLIPEVRLGWNHEFLDASQKITGSLIGVPGASFTTTGIAVGRDAVLIGAGSAMELSPDAKVFVDYDGRLASRVQEHSISGGVRVRF